MARPDPEGLRASFWRQGLCRPQIPQGFVRADSQCYTHPTSNALLWSTLYARGGENLGFNVTKLTGPSGSIFEKDNAPVGKYMYHGVTRYTFHSSGTTTAVWMVGTLLYSLWATGKAADMQELIRSAYQGQSSAE